MRILVIAGNRSQGDNWIKSNIEKRTKAGETVNWHDYYYVSHVDGIKGFSNPHGVFVGSWRDRDDILDIVETLYHSNTSPNPPLEKILIQVRRAKRKHIKLPQSVAVEEAAALLAKEIDQQVLDQLIGKKPTVFDIMEEYDQMSLAAPTTWKGFVK